MQHSLTLASIEDDILRSLRRISRAIDLHSKHLASTFGLTGPQLVALRTVGQLEEAAPSEIAREVSLSQATMTGIIDRLAARQLVTRERTSKDRRRVTVRLTDAGRALIEQAPSPLQERFVDRLQRLEPEEQHRIKSSLERIVEMMGGDDLDAAPVLDPGATLPDGARIPPAATED
ncbi:MAG: MarR family transcriptional regulator [Deltaproteobacteria bacterium]